MPSHFFTIESESGDGQRLTLGTGLFHPIVDATRNVMAVANLRDDALQSGLTGVLVHLATIDLEALAELDVGLAGDLLEQGLTLELRQLPDVVAVEVQQIEGVLFSVTPENYGARRDLPPAADRG
jgi:hypothetical protein